MRKQPRTNDASQEIKDTIMDKVAALAKTKTKISLENGKNAIVDLTQELEGLKNKRDDRNLKSS